ncbi:hypothetical protein [Bosea thiooxidans]
MAHDWGFVVWIVLIAVPLGIALAAFWARSRRPGAARLDPPSAEDPRDPV